MALLCSKAYMKWQNNLLLNLQKCHNLCFSEKQLSLEAKHSALLLIFKSFFIFISYLTEWDSQCNSWKFLTGLHFETPHKTENSIWARRNSVSLYCLHIPLLPLLGALYRGCFKTHWNSSETLEWFWWPFFLCLMLVESRTCLTSCCSISVKNRNAASYLTTWQKRKPTLFAISCQTWFIPVNTVIDICVSCSSGAGLKFKLFLGY